MAGRSLAPPDRLPPRIQRRRAYLASDSSPRIDPTRDPTPDPSPTPHDLPSRPPHRPARSFRPRGPSPPNPGAEAGRSADLRSTVHEALSSPRGSVRGPRDVDRLCGSWCASGDAATSGVAPEPTLGGGALRWQGQIARATRGRDLHLNVPFPRKPPDLLMAESPPTGGLSALTATAAVPYGGSGQNVVQRRREPLARLLERALDVQARRAGLGP
jgi:hypothetical protein